MDFYRFRTKENKNGTTELYPGFIVGRSTDLMVRGGQFYAVWDEEVGLWSTDEYAVARLVDKELYEHAKSPEHAGRMMVVRDMASFESTSWSNFKKFINQIQDSSVQLDQNLTFANTPVKKTDYVSKRLPYSLEQGDYSAWDELVGTLYSVDERAKIEWIIGAIVSGDSKKIQKFGVFYGPPGSGKGTIMDIMHKLFEGYTTTFEANQLASANAQFALEVFKHYPLLAIQGDGNLSKIQDNARINSIVSHEPMTVNEKFKSAVTDIIYTFLVMGTNSPVQITDAKSGIIRRLIDIHPTGVKIPINHYFSLIARTDFELGAIAQHCLEVYQDMGRNFYEAYRPLEMMLQTDPFFNFIEYYFDVFKGQDGVGLTQAYSMYKEYCGDSGIERPMQRQKFQYELRNYFEKFHDRAEVDGHQVRSYYSGFSANKFKAPAKDDNVFTLVLEDEVSLLDDILADMPAQGAREDEFGALIPEKFWDDKPRMIRDKMQPPRPSQVVSTTLKDLDTGVIHFVKIPRQHIVIDFDIKDPITGEKSLELNLQAASNWPPTYGEISKGGNGVHLHYLYEGDDIEELAPAYSEGIEVKTLLGNASLRRRLSKCNTVPIAPMKSGMLPLKEKKMLDERTIQSEKGVRAMIARNLAKEIHPNTSSSVSFIKKVLDDAYEAGLPYDVSDLKGQVMAFAAKSSNSAVPSLRMVTQMKWKSEDSLAGDDPISPGDMTPKERVEAEQLKNIGSGFVKDDRIAFYDVEVFPNLFVICWKFEDADTVVRMVNPSAVEVEQLLRLKLVGFFNRRYDNHIIYAASLGYPVEELYKRSQKIVEHNDNSSMFGEAYGLSFADIWDFASIKQSLKKWMIQLGLRHLENDHPWDQPVPPEMIDKIVEYCVNDVLGTEQVFKNRRQDFVARQILASLSGLTVNDTTQKHTARILFGNDRTPQTSFKYTDLSVEFPGYTFDPFRKDAEGVKLPASDYRGEDPSEGGYVDQHEGYHTNVLVLDVASMHPTSIVNLDLFGQYTPKFKDLLDARVAIKRGQYDEARKMLDGKLAPYLTDESAAEQLSYALKIVINIVYGLTSAKFDNPFRDLRNKDNIVAKRGALFMIDLKHYVQDLIADGVLPADCLVVHIKTDSIKISNPSRPDLNDQIKQLVTDFGAKYGYEFEHEATYDKFCLVNKAVYIAHYGWAEKEKKIGTWDATGAQFQHPYVFKTLFSGEELSNADYAETKQVTQGAIYMDHEHDRPEVGTKESMKFVGRVGRFVPVVEGQGGAVLYRFKDDKPYKVTGTTGHLWLEADVAFANESIIDMTYFEKLVSAAKDSIGKYVDPEEFVR